MNNVCPECLKKMALSSRYADELKPGHRIVIDNHFFPKGSAGTKIHDEDAICFQSEPLWVQRVNSKSLKVKDGAGHVIYIPLEWKTVGTWFKGTEKMRSVIKGPNDTQFFIWLW